MPRMGSKAASWRRAGALRALALVLVAAPLVVLAARAATRDAKPDGYPHGAFKGECGDCHGAAGWTPARFSRKFNHAKYGFALGGAHAAADCQSCHTSLDFSVEKTRCASCHTDPHHDELGQDCARCHTSRSFIDRSGMVRGHQVTRFALTGSHMLVECESCHRPAAAGQMQFVGVDAACYSCHSADFAAATSPDHSGSGFSTECTTCHTTISWHGGRFDHARVAGTPCANCHLANYQAAADPDHQGAGFPLECQSCHTTRAWSPATFDHAAVAGTPCTTCHMSDYQAAADPNHAANNFPLACESCHSTTAWQPATFDHASVNGTPCANCHTADYQATTNPAHQGAGFPMTCGDCHTTTAWQPATFDHTPWFPIYSGTHLGRWNACADCHEMANNYASFTCLSCHPHSDQTETDGHHQGFVGYSYTSQACYTCHPDGRK